MTVKQLLAKRKVLAEQQKQFITENNERDALVIEGQLNMLEEQIEQMAEEEENARNAALSHTTVQDVTSIAERVFGPRGSFKGIENGFRKSAPILNAISGLNTPQIYRTDLPSPMMPPIGFLDTIPHGATDGDEHFFMTPVLTNNAAGWTTGDKPESALTWTEGVAHLETIAHHMPIKKQTANRYSTLEGIVNNSLMMGLRLKTNELSVRGNNNSGIVGIANTSGILTHTKNANKNLKDTFAAMRRKVRVACGFAPTHIALSPYAIEELSEAKDNTGRYLFPDMAAGSNVAGLTIVEDVNMTVVSGATSTETSLVYCPFGASFDIADPEEIIIGLINSQLIQNEYTILAEMTAALRVDMPAGFCYCSDLGITQEA